MIFWEKNQKDVSLACRHFGISRKTFYKWVKRFDVDFLKGLEDLSRAPIRLLGYLPPINFTFKYKKVLPVYPYSIAS